MKHQYFGDVNDYVKYGLLRCMTGAGLSAGVCWMLTPDDERSDGRKIDYITSPDIWQRHDPALFGQLSSAFNSTNGRHLRHIEADGALPLTCFFGDTVPTSLAARSSWFARALEKLAGCDLLFFDPDNGIEVKSHPPGTRQSPKYVYWQELRDAWDRSSSLLIYQHFPRIERSTYISARAQRLQLELDGAQVTCLISSNVLFLLAGQAKHQQQLAAALAALRMQWSPRIGFHAEH